MFYPFNPDKLMPPMTYFWAKKKRMITGNETRVEAAGHGVVDDGLLLFVEQLDHAPLDTDVAANLPVSVVEIPDNNGLLGK